MGLVAHSLTELLAGMRLGEDGPAGIDIGMVDTAAGGIRLTAGQLSALEGLAGALQPCLAAGRQLLDAAAAAEPACTTAVLAQLEKPLASLVSFGMLALEAAGSRTGPTAAAGGGTPVAGGRTPPGSPFPSKAASRASEGLVAGPAALAEAQAMWRAMLGCLTRMAESAAAATGPASADAAAVGWAQVQASLDLLEDALSCGLLCRWVRQKGAAYDACLLAHCCCLSSWAFARAPA